MPLDDQQQADDILTRLMEQLQGEYVLEALANHWVGVAVNSTEELREVLQMYVNSPNVSETDRSLIRQALDEAGGAG